MRVGSYRGCHRQGRIIGATAGGRAGRNYGRSLARSECSLADPRVVTSRATSAPRPPDPPRERATERPDPAPYTHTHTQHSKSPPTAPHGRVCFCWFAIRDAVGFGVLSAADRRPRRMNIYRNLSRCVRAFFPAALIGLREWKTHFLGTNCMLLVRVARFSKSLGVEKIKSVKLE